jgi:hypothetical protein
MATTYKVLGQSKPTAATATNLYTVPASTQTVVSTLVISNLSIDITNVRVSVRPAGEVQADKHYIIYDQSFAGYQLMAFTLGLTLATTDVVTIYDSAGKCSFNLFGSEIS